MEIVRMARWVARIAGSAMVVLFVAFAAGEGLPHWNTLATRERLIFLAWACVLAGLAAAWKWEGFGGALALVGAGLLCAGDAGLARVWLVWICAGAAALHLACWFTLRSRPHGGTSIRPAWAAAFFVAIGLFLALAANEIFGMPPLMTPSFDSQAGVVGAWRDQNVSLKVNPDGSVSGQVGDEAIAHGRLWGNRSWFGRLMNWRTDYLVRGDLAGRSFSGAFSVRDGTLEGSLFVSGKPRRVRLVRE
jgi:hypothetical protein